jgi:hypothetical protein
VLLSERVSVKVRHAIIWLSELVHRDESYCIVRNLGKR